MPKLPFPAGRVARHCPRQHLRSSRDRIWRRASLRAARSMVVSYTTISERPGNELSWWPRLGRRASPRDADTNCTAVTRRQVVFRNCSSSLCSSPLSLFVFSFISAGAGLTVRCVRCLWPRFGGDAVVASSRAVAVLTRCAISVASRTPAAMASPAVADRPRRAILRLFRRLRRCLRWRTRGLLRREHGWLFRRPRARLRPGGFFGSNAHAYVLGRGRSPVITTGARRSISAATPHD